MTYTDDIQESRPLSPLVATSCQQRPRQSPRISLSTLLAGVVLLFEAKSVFVRAKRQQCRFLSVLDTPCIARWACLQVSTSDRAKVNKMRRVASDALAVQLQGIKTPGRNARAGVVFSQALASCLLQHCGAARSSRTAGAPTGSLTAGETFHKKSLNQMASPKRQASGQKVGATRLYGIKSPGIASSGMIAP
jgi:hypothetical protein